MSEPKKISDLIPEKLISEKSTKKLTKYSGHAPKLSHYRNKVVELELPYVYKDDEGKEQVDTAKMTINNAVPVHENTEFIKGFFTLLAQSNGEDIPKLQKWLWFEDFKRNDVTPVEAIKGLFGARADEYLPKTGIEFRHVMKHIRKFRSETYEVPEPGPTMEEYLEGKVSDSAD